MIRCDKENALKAIFAIRSEYKAYELNGKVLGLIGCGHIGNILAEMATGIGMKVLVYDPFVKAEVVEAKGYGYRTEMEDIFKRSRCSIYSHTIDTKN